MKLGIDFGTSNTIVSYMENNMPLVMRFHHAGITKDLFPSASFYSKNKDQGYHGIEALERAFTGEGTLVRSIKRSLKNYYQGLQFQSGKFQREVKGIGLDFLRNLKMHIVTTHHLSPEDPLEVMLTVPANANGAQRSITRECFKEAGFILSPKILEEPTASAIEFSYSGLSERLRKQGKPINILVYDLGGGTFDVSLIRIEPDHYAVLATAGIEQLGGDDFDQILYQMVVEKKALSGLTPLQEKLLLYRCREAKENLANTIDPKYIRIDLEEAHISDESVKMRVDEYSERLLPLLNRTLDKIDEVLYSQALQNQGIQGMEHIEKIYLVGGSSQLPLILKLITKKYGQGKVHLSSIPFASIALGACRMGQQKIQGEDILSRTFGVFRVAGPEEYFDPIFEKGVRIPATKRYEIQPAHNIGHYRYLECAECWNGEPISPRMWSEILFPYDPAWDPNQMPRKEDITKKKFRNNKVIEEFLCDENGIITVNLHREIDSFAVKNEIWR
ncbi:MAG: Hsp70 family protein [bacterium]